MQSRSRLQVGFSFHCCSQGFPSIVNLILTVIYIYNTYLHWHELSSCFRRQSIIVAFGLIYNQLKFIIQLSSLIENLQFMVAFLLVEKLNFADQLSTEGCLKPTSIFASITYILYFFLFGYYIVSMIVFMFVLTGAILYDCYYYTIALPRRRHRTSVRGRDFDELEVIKYNKSAENLPHSELSCSICLADFDEDEPIIRLPICWHLFHKKCIKIWLDDHRECPYCRADVKTNLKLWKRDGKRCSREMDSRQSQNRDSGISNAVNIENAPQVQNNDNQNNSVVYVELRDV